MDENQTNFRRADDILFELAGPSLSESKRLELQQELTAIKQQLDPEDRLLLEKIETEWLDLEASIRVTTFYRFAAKLVHRQGSRRPDFDALYHRKAMLDRKFENR